MYKANVLTVQGCTRLPNLKDFKRFSKNSLLISLKLYSFKPPFFLCSSSLPSMSHNVAYHDKLILSDIVSSKCLDYVSVVCVHKKGQENIQVLAVCHINLLWVINSYCFKPPWRMRDWLYPLCFVRFQIEFLVQKTENFDELMVATAEERECGDYKEQNWINMFWSYLC